MMHRIDRHGHGHASAMMPEPRQSTAELINHVRGTPVELPHTRLDHGYPRQRYLDPGCNVHRSRTQVATHEHTPCVGFSVGVPRLNSPVLE